MIYPVKPIVNLRIYTVIPRKMPQFLHALDTYGMPVLVRHLGQPLGTYTSAVGMLNQFVHLWGYDDMGDFERRHKAREADPDWPAYMKATVDLLVSQEDQLLRHCPMKNAGPA